MKFFLEKHIIIWLLLEILITNLFAFTHSFTSANASLNFWKMLLSDGPVENMCNGYGGWITTTNQEQLISFFNMSPGEHPTDLFEFTARGQVSMQMDRCDVSGLFVSVAWAGRCSV